MPVVKLEDKHKEVFKDVQKLIEDYGKIKLTERDVRIFIRHLLTNDFEYWTDEFKFNSFDDTSPREKMLYSFALKFLKYEWPINGDSDEFKKAFYADLREVAKRRKWKLLF